MSGSLNRLHPDHGDRLIGGRDNPHGRPSMGSHVSHRSPHHGSSRVATNRPGSVFGRVMEGVERMFERMVREHQHRIYAVGFALTGNRHDAEEVAQDTFLRAYRALATYPPERIRDLKQRPWLYRIAVNVVRNRARGARPRIAIDAAGGDGRPRLSPRWPAAALSRGRRAEARARDVIRRGRRDVGAARWDCQVQRASRPEAT